MPNEKVVIAGNDYNINVIYTANKNSSARIDGNDIIIKISRLLDRREQEMHAIKLKKWAIRRIERNPGRYKKYETEHKDGDMISVWGKQYCIRIEHTSNRTSTAYLHGNEIVLNISNGLDSARANRAAHHLVRKVISRDMLPWLENKVKHINDAYFGFEYNNVIVRDTKTKWGSCSSNKNISLSYRLLFAPEDVLEYVCAHELAHLQEMNHSKQFWQLVQKAVPDFRERKRWLMRNGCRLG